MTKHYFQAITRVKKSDQQSVISLFFFFFLIWPSVLPYSACQYIEFLKKVLG